MSNTIPANNNTGLYNATGNAVPTTGNITTNNISATGNVIVGGYITANGSITTNANFVGNLVGNVTGNITVAGANDTVLFVENGVTQTSNAFSFNPTSNVVTVQGNVSGNYFVGNGSLLTGVVTSSYGNSNVEAFLPTYTGAFSSLTGNVTTTANISGAYILGNGSQLTGLPATYGNANVATFLPTYTGNLTANIISTTGNIVSAANLVTSGAGGNIVGANYVTANYFAGDGSQLTNLPAGALSGNLTGNLQGNSFGANAFSFVSATGNVTGNYIVGNGSLLTNLTGANVTGTVANATFATSASTATSATTAATVTTNAQPNITSVGTLTVLSSSGNITGANILTAGVVSATGNVSGNFFIGNGSQLTGLPETYGNANVAANLAAFGSNPISTTGNVTAGYFIGNGSLLTNLTGANVTGTVANATFATSASTATSATTAATVTGAAQANITSVGTLTSLAVTGNITTGNILTDNYLYANGSPINFAGTYGNSNVASFMAAFGSNVVSTTGTITSGNITGANILTAGIVSATGNVTGNYIIGDGSALTSITGANVTGTVANATYATNSGTATSATTAATVTGNAQANITSVGTLTSLSSSGNITGANILTAGIVSATGNITGNYFLGNGSQLTGISAAPGGSANTLQFNNGGALGGITDAFHYTANGITEISKIKFSSTASGGGSGELFVPGTVGYVSVVGNIIGGNITSAGVISAVGNITAANLGNVSALNLNGNSSQVLYGNGVFAAVTGGGGSPGGSPFQFQYNDSGNFGGIPNTNYYSGNGIIEMALTKFEATGVSGIVTVPGSAGYVSVTGNVIAGNVFTGGTVSATGNITGANILTAGIVSATGNVSGDFFIGNGSQLTGIAASYGNANVATFLAAYGSNTITTTGNVTVGNILATNIGNVAALNLNANASQVLYGNGVFAPVAGGGTYGDSNVATFLGAFGSNTISTTGNATVGNIIATNIGNVAALNLNANASTVLYGNGVFAAVAGGGSPGNSNTQIQFNDGGAFAGNTNMTFDKTSGNITLGNVVYNALNVIPGNTWPDVANITVTSNVVTNPTRMVLGTGFFGNLSSQYNFFNQTSNTGGGVGARLLISDASNLTGASARLSSVCVQNWHILTANVLSNSSQTYQGISCLNMIGGGPSSNTSAITNPVSYAAITGTINVGSGTANTLTSTLGNTTVAAVLAVNGSLTIGVNSAATTGIIFRAGPQYSASNIAGNVQYGNITNLAGFLTQMSGTPLDANVVQTANVAHFYVPGTTAGFIPGASTANIPRMATSYFAFRNDDDLAQVKLGRLSSFNELRYTSATTSGSLTIDKANGQVQEVVLTGNVTSVAFSNFVTQVLRPNASYVETTDTVTIIFRQDATGYAVTMPSGTAYKYAAGTSTLGTTANSVSMVSVTGVYNSTAAATEYLITVSPEFT